jgi:excisionase family DNA binding protein
MAELMGTTEVARLLNVSRRTVSGWIRAGRLPAFQTPGRRWRIRRADALRISDPDAQSELRPDDDSVAAA